MAALKAIKPARLRAKKLYLIHRSELRADEISQRRLRQNKKVEVMLQTEIKKLHGNGRLESIDVVDKISGEEKNILVDGIFVNIGVEANTELFKDEIKLSASGRIIAGEDCRTNIAGVFAAGDVREKEIRQLTTAASDGTTAALLAEKFIRALEK